MIKTEFMAEEIFAMVLVKRIYLDENFKVARRHHCPCMYFNDAQRQRIKDVGTNANFQGSTSPTSLPLSPVFLDNRTTPTMYSLRHTHLPSHPLRQYALFDPDIPPALLEISRLRLY
ncbi:hypothetical protein BDN72DRAFT_906317 [Pluteus cervinus]|uniref:Uncharacterized protein n=1 Tax=Pluteus cervinus TaxID=181527 RepID=A0ACD2ZZX1_9AGAR|nr:hypothetical protein BDN72DRAFT_906317 [Pluteus cervinus]